jgi:hypothetical protein
MTVRIEYYPENSIIIYDFSVVAYITGSQFSL